MTDSKSTSKLGGGEKNLIVALRIRPMAEDEIIQGANPAAYKVENNMVVLLDPADDPDDVLRVNRSREKQFVFDCIFDGSCSQEHVYEETTKFLIPNVTNGYNATVFAYGPTGAGKTYTMLGKDGEPGIMVQALNDLFLEMRQNTDKTFKVTMSYLEIYNEMIRDLLNPDSGFLELREDAKGSVQVAGISEVTARSTEEVMNMLVKGNLERTQEPTAANATSSRSHAILQVTVKQRNRVRNVMQEVRTGRLFLVDLAGSERAANTHNRGKRMVEGAHINRSLLALGNCINALSDKNGPKYINYRDSKLTRLLKDALGGNCRTVMIAHISPASTQFEESRNTLVYADRAKHIKTKVRRNVTDVAYHIAQYSNIISELRDEIMRLRSKLTEQTQYKHSVANIQAVQSEVVESQRKTDKSELTHFKEQLLTSFKDQMELRRTLMELNNASMEISLETNRNQLVISEYQVEKGRQLRNRENTGLTDNKFTAEDKENEAPDSDGEPVEVQVARDELKVLHEEKHKTERVKTTIQRELETARAKTNKLQELIPIRISNADQQEILKLLCRVHQLEIESLEGQSARLLGDFQIRHKDMVITKLHHYRNLSDDIIKRQKQIIEEHKLYCPPELQQLYELYSTEQNHRLLKGDDISSFSSIDKVASVSNLNVPSTPKIRDEDEDSNKVFTQSAKTKQILKANRVSDIGYLQNDIDIQDHIPTPTAPSRISYEDRTVINANTRSIAALAAKKRNQASIASGATDKFGVRPLYRPQVQVDDDDFDDFGTKLTPSRLAQHNRNMGDGVYNFSGGEELGERISVITDPNLPPLRTIGSVGSRQIQEQEEARRRAVRYTGNNNGSYLEKSRHQSRKLSEQRNRNLQRRNNNNNHNNHNNNINYYNGSNRLFLDDTSTVRSSTPNTVTSDLNRRTSQNTNTVTSDPNRRTSHNTNILKKNKKKLPTSSQSESSNGGTNQPERRIPQVLPTIPQYRKGDITVTGTATNAARY
ncbi:kinesin-like protein KIF19 isoform X2 [Physella acuta]|uniref:kinesin-like protein KIF19 isoform X1 n=1 Tax=Physella acuta TaxID=109671 RepID=UPI0027DD29D3|nr:kinesin-like protein KIF19 isoform X1 [Physella acuta]XP_059157155.1 kinesin-like protein KIF19 isoform X1 [Physella acuta]XP_059157156.1 kinesin-like protein KIF19 isoform X2 [Physella acuta]